MSDTTPRTSMRFQIEVIKDRKLTEVVFDKVLDEVTGKPTLVRKERERVVPESYMVYFPNGHSIWCETKGDLQRLKLTETDNFEVDLETGLPVVPPHKQDLKALVAARTRSSRQG